MIDAPLAKRFMPVRFEWAALCLIVVVFLLADVRADISINDDWAYYKTAYWLYYYHQLDFTNWQQMTLVSQSLLAWLWADLFGFSQLSLRLLTISVSFVGLLFLRNLMLLLCRERLLASAASLTFYLGPLTLASTASFMTDIYFWTPALGAILFLFPARPDHFTWRREGLGWALAFVALMVRQLAVAIPLGLIVVHLLRGDRWRIVLARGLLPLIAGLAILAIFRHVALLTIGLPSDFDNPNAQLKAVLIDLLHVQLGALRPLLRGAALGSLYLGLVTIPLGLPLFHYLPRGRARIAAAGAGAGGLLLAVLLDSPIGGAGNILESWGLGPRLLTTMVRPPAGASWWLLTGLACWSIANVYVATALFFGSRGPAGLWRRLREEALIVGLLVTAIAGYAPLILIYGPWIDRHLLFSASLVLAAATGVAAKLAGRPIGTAVAIVALPFALWSVALLHDAFAWRRAVVAAAGALQQAGTAPRDIDGGFEYVNLAALPDRPNQRQPEPIDGKRDLPCTVGERVPPGRRVIATEIASRWLASGDQLVYGYCRR